MIFAPDHRGAIVRPSPNFGARRGVSAPDVIILHYTGMATGNAAEDWLCVPESQVSSHYLVHEDGQIIQMVRETDRAWHAGASSWKGDTDMNSRSVGIEIVNRGHSLGYDDFPDVQIEAVANLCADIVARQRIVPHNVLAHSDVAPGRKVDPGERFPWRTLFERGVGLWVEPVAVRGDAGLAIGARGNAVARLQSRLSAFGYGLTVSGEYDQRTADVVAAFQRHFRPQRVDGHADASTIETLDALLRLVS